MRWLIGFVFVVAVLPGCRKPTGEVPLPDVSQRHAKIFVTTGMLADVVHNVGMHRVEITCLMGPGIDPHRYIPEPSVHNTLEQADLIFYNGLHLEGKMTDLFAALAKKKRTIAVAEGLPGLRPAEVDMEGTHDPHVWFDVKLWMRVVERVCDSLVELDPQHASVYRSNATSYLAQLTELDAEIRAKIAKLPPSKRVLITAHDAFGYFGRAYGFEVRGLQGVSTATDTGLKSVQALADEIGTKKIKTIFAETSVSDKGLQAVQQAVREKFKGFTVELAATPLYSDALGEKHEPGGTYIGMVRHNVDTIVNGLAD